MRRDNAGATGFAGAMVATMVVVTVLSAYMAAAPYLLHYEGDPLIGFDTDRLTGTVEDGTFVPGYDDYLHSYLEVSGHRGVEVRALLVGSGSREVVTTVGEMDGEVTWKRVSALVDRADGGRVIAVFGVGVCV